MSKLQEIRDALRKYAADEAECHVRGMTHIPKTACDALAALDALMETHALVPIEPTKKMVKAGYTPFTCIIEPYMCEAYKAMITAAQEEKDE